jgi:aspartyl-tRNA(Asn)/glutamyl-tRNA(Gln) amidotransferase subunit A
MPEPFELSVTAAARLIRDRVLSPVELFNSLIARIELTETHLLAWATLLTEKALTDAKRAEQLVQTGEAQGQIHGVPYGAKDIFDTAGITTAAGSTVWAHRVPRNDATTIKKLRDSGAILLGKTHTTEFADGDPAPSRNPRNPRHTPGGSSTGSAVAVASRMVPAALGSQTVGSVLRPAAYNGIVGLKPTFGRISRAGVIPLSSTFDHVGILVRTVEDAALMLGSLSGHDPLDPYSSITPVPDYVAELNRGYSPPKIGFLKRHFLDRSDGETRLQMERVAQELSGAGANVEEIDMPIDFDLAFEAHRTIQYAETAAWHEKLYRPNKHLYRPKIAAMIEAGFSHSAMDYVHATELLRDVHRKTLDAVQKIDVVMMPTASSAPLPDLTSTGDISFQSLWTFVGFPSISIPIGLASNGLPLGVQFASGPFRELDLLRAAKWAEEVLNVRLFPPVLKKH